MNDNALAAAVARGTEFLSRHLNSKAATEFNRAIELDPRNIAAWRGRAKVLLEAGDTDEAIAELGRTIELDPTDAASWAARGDAHHENDDPTRAIADYTESLRLAPRNTNVLERRASAYIFKGDFERADADYHQMMRLAPNDPVPYCRRADIFAALGQFSEAIANCSQAIALAATAEHYYQRGRIHLRMGDNTSALADFAEAIRITPNFPDAFQARSKLWAAMGDRARADADYDEAMRLGAMQWGDYCWRQGVAFRRDNDHEQAIAEFTRAISNYDALLRMFPEDARLLHRRGLLKREIGDEPGGNADIAAAMALNPDIAETATPAINFPRE